MAVLRSQACGSQPFQASVQARLVTSRRQADATKLLQGVPSCSSIQSPTSSCMQTRTRELSEHVKNHGQDCGSLSNWPCTKSPGFTLPYAPGSKDGEASFYLICEPHSRLVRQSGGMPRVDRLQHLSTAAARLQVHLAWHMQNSQHISVQTYCATDAQVSAALQCCSVIASLPDPIRAPDFHLSHRLL